MFITIATTSAAALTAATVAIFPEKNPVVPIPVVPYEAPPPVQQKYVCDDCTINEAITLSFLQERGIEDKATLLPLWVTLSRKVTSLLTSARVVLRFLMQVVPKVVMD